MSFLYWTWEVEKGKNDGIQFTDVCDSEYHTEDAEIGRSCHRRRRCRLLKCRMRCTWPVDVRRTVRRELTRAVTRMLLVSAADLNISGSCAADATAGCTKNRLLLKVCNFCADRVSRSHVCFVCCLFRWIKDDDNDIFAYLSRYIVPRLALSRWGKWRTL